MIGFIAPIHRTYMMNLLLFNKNHIYPFIYDVINRRFICEIAEDQVEKSE